jgi:hypothetical protein
MTVLKQTLKAAVVALALGGTAITAMPAQAQSRPNVDFNFQFGTDGFRFGIGRDRPGRHCMRDPEVRRDLRRDGYDHIRFFDRRGRIVQVTASLGRRDFRIAYDTCRGRIIDRDRIRRR